ncbi:MAG: Na+/H+ antiporter subunit G [Rudaea sp.]
MNADALPAVAEVLVALFLVIGSSFALIGSWGLAKLPDFYTRLHGPSKASTLGVGGMLLASMIYFTAYQHTPSLHEILITLLLFVTTPVSAHLVAKAALHRKLRSVCGLPGDSPAADDPEHP